MDVTQLVRQATPTNLPPLARGRVFGGANHPGAAPTAFGEPVYVILPEGSSEHLYGPCKWLAGHGTAKPQPGAACVVGFDEQNQPTIFWWDGPQEEDADILPISNTLPAEPVNGQVVYYQQKGSVGESVMEEQGIVWAFRYRSASASTHKWEFVGGSGIFNNVVTAQATASAAYVDLATVGPSVTVPLAGDYGVRFGARATVLGGAANAVAQLFIGAAEGAEFLVVGNAVNSNASVYTEARVIGLSAAVVLKLKYASEGAKEVQFARRVLNVVPVRVG